MHGFPVSSSACVTAECDIADFPFFIFSEGDVGGTRIYPGFFFFLNECVIKSVVTDFKQVPVTG